MLWIATGGLASAANSGGAKSGNYYRGNNGLENNVVNYDTTDNNIYHVEGAYAQAANQTATNNQVTIGGNVDLSPGHVAGAYLHGKGVHADGNTVIINSGTINDVYGGYALGGEEATYGTSTASGNTVTINGGTIKQSVVGGYFRNGGTAAGNTITLNGATVGNSVYGGYSSSGTLTCSGNVLILSGTNTVKWDVKNFETIQFDSENLAWDTSNTVLTLTEGNFENCGKLDVSAVTAKATANGTMTLLQATSNDLPTFTLSTDEIATTEGVTVQSTAKTGGMGGVTIGYNNTHTVKLADTKTITYTVANSPVNKITLGEIAWNTGGTVFNGSAYDYTGVTNANIDTTNFKFTNPEAVTGSMTLLANATNLAAGENIAHTQSFTKDANGATLSATLSGNVIRTTANEIGYTATGTTLNSVNLAGWNGTAGSVPDGWTANASGVDVTAAGFTAPNLAAGASTNILTAGAAFFNDNQITGAMKYAAGAESSDTVNGVTLTGAESKGVKASADGKNLVYARSNFTVSNVSLGEMTWGTGRAASAGYDFANVASVNAAGLRFTNPEAATGSMTLLSNAENLAAGKNVTGANHTQTINAKANGATLSGTLSGTVATVANAVNYTVTEKTLSGVNLAGWNGTAYDLTGWTSNLGANSVTAAGFAAPDLAAGATRNILTTSTNNFFNDNQITGAMKYAASASSADTMNGVTLAGAEWKGVKASADGKNLVYARSNFTVSNISLGEMTWGTGRAASAGYDFANVASVNAAGLRFTNPEAATGSMTILSNATGLAAGENLAHTQTFTADANGATLSATLSGNVTQTAGKIGYTATGTALSGVSLANWNGTAGNVPDGWTANEGGVAVTAAGFAAPNLATGASTNILTAGAAFFSDEKITGAMKYQANTASSDTENGVTLTGAESKGVKASADGRSLVYARSNFGVNKISLGAVEWGTARAAGEAGYDYANATVDTGAMTFTNPEAISAGSTTLLQANNTLAAIAATEKNVAYAYSPVAGVTVSGIVNGSYKTAGNAITYTATANNATKLAFGNVAWKETDALMTRPANIAFAGANVDTSKINFTNISALDANKEMTLVANFDGDGTETFTGATYKVGSTLQGKGKAELDEAKKNLLFKTESAAEQIASGDMTVQEQTHNTVMGATVAMAALSAGNDFIGAATEGLALASNVGADGVSSFARIGGGSIRQETGSHVDTHTWNAILALGTKNKKERGTMEYGAFFEYGSGNYTTHNGDERGDGSAHYTGGGLLAKWTAKHGFYVEGSLRAGTVHDDARNVLRDGFGNPYSYETNANYFGGHIGVGKEFTLNNGNVVDVYGKYFVNRRNGVSFDVGGRYDLDAVTSQIVRIGARYTVKSSKWSFYAGAAYEHEMDGKATGKADGFAIRSADTSGGSFRGELGATVTPDKNVPVTLDFNLTGFAGKKQGFSGGVSVALMF